jgi:hypothetical protein
MLSFLEKQPTWLAHANFLGEVWHGLNINVAHNNSHFEKSTWALEIYCGTQ